jgi:flagellar basal body-associated protein FliL
MGKLLWPIIAAVLFFVGIGGGVGAMMVFGPKPSTSETVKPVAALKPPPNADLAYDLPAMIVPLGGQDGPGNILRAELTLQCSDHETMERIQAYLPRILDVVQIHLHDAGPGRFKGRSGLDKIRAELKPLIEKAIAPAHIESVVIRDFTIS